MALALLSAWPVILLSCCSSKRFVTGWVAGVRACETLVGVRRKCRVSGYAYGRCGVFCPCKQGILACSLGKGSLVQKWGPSCAWPRVNCHSTLRACCFALSQSVQAAVNRIPKTGWLMSHRDSQFWQLGSPSSRCQQIWCLARASSLVHEWQEG